MNVQFMNDEMMSEILQKDSLMQLKSTIEENKKLLFIKDLDLNSIFLRTSLAIFWKYFKE